MGGRFLLPLNAGNRAKAGVAAGDEIEVELELDTAPREASVPADFADVLAGEPEARRFFDGLSYSHRRRYVMWIEDAKQADTRERRITKAIGMLKEGRAQ
ncbi:MAG: DUF1905 domain-containing protein [Propionibacteriales bacterium]|nr:DUF1905 domain-containing protein [Propionibacteriales bacterium]